MSTSSNRTLSAAQLAQINNRDRAGRFKEAAHAEGDLPLEAELDDESTLTQVLPDGSRRWTDARGELHRRNAPAIEWSEGGTIRVAFWEHGQAVPPPPDRARRDVVLLEHGQVQNDTDAAVVHLDTLRNADPAKDVDVERVQDFVHSARAAGMGQETQAGIDWLRAAGHTPEPARDPAPADIPVVVLDGGQVQRATGVEVVTLDVLHADTPSPSELQALSRRALGLRLDQTWRRANEVIESVTQTPFTQLTPDDWEAEYEPIEPASGESFWEHEEVVAEIDAGRISNRQVWSVTHDEVESISPGFRIVNRVGYMVTPQALAAHPHRRHRPGRPRRRW